MISASAFAVFALGLRHGADPDHLAAIDNLTRSSLLRHPKLSRFSGTLFAFGHTIMVLSIAVLVGYLGTRFTGHRAFLEALGSWTSIAVLFALGAMNLYALRSPIPRVAGLRSRFLPATFSRSGTAWAAMPVGFLFGVGFETSSQIAAYTIVFGAQAGIIGSLLVGAAFCMGMLCTDTLDSVLVHRLVSMHASLVPRIMRLWVLTIALLAIGVAVFQLARVLGAQFPVPDLWISGIIVGVLLLTFAKTATLQKQSPPA
jgi:high-affinity nickel-transport protein